MLPFLLTAGKVLGQLAMQAASQGVSNLMRPQGQGGGMGFGQQQQGGFISPLIQSMQNHQQMQRPMVPPTAGAQGMNPGAFHGQYLQFDPFRQYTQGMQGMMGQNPYQQNPYYQQGSQSPFGGQ